MDCNELHLAPNEKTQPIRWTERPTCASLAAGSLCPTFATLGQAVFVFCTHLHGRSRLKSGSESTSHRSMSTRIPSTGACRIDCQWTGHTVPSYYCPVEHAGYCTISSTAATACFIQCSHLDCSHLHNFPTYWPTIPPINILRITGNGTYTGYLHLFWKAF
jgi:hypothetical protein